jgi:hypothetical protein
MFTSYVRGICSNLFNYELHGIEFANLFSSFGIGCSSNYVFVSNLNSIIFVTESCLLRCFYFYFLILQYKVFIFISNYITIYITWRIDV